ncbi:MFS transporter [Yinghuangia seranimata]|uniref:MFS transporter n=1 Tax=Yinghuangia seranimata TaxID=408067 RepID=UPI00248D1829|nr:MFS transporter [Yinghuangia seranimata]MDI2127247.1 MFS transporter [Yinghuangia seranimata]MDI2132192.1 MFS transporter [Yinghuangia seranimata]
MYLSSSRSGDVTTGVRPARDGRVPQAATPPARASRVARVVAPNVIALGLVSLVTDISSEMVTAILPVYLVLGLGLSPLAFGMLDGLYNGATAFLRVAGGHIADRTRRHKPVAGLGYGLSAACKLALPAVSSVPGIGAVITADRMGKGIRTAPRDALISLSSPADQQGRAFGVHRAFDTTGALLGPFAAMAVLWFTAQAYDAVFVVSFCFAAFAVLLLVLYVREAPAAPEAKAATGRPRLREAVAVLRVPGFARVCAYALVLGAATIGDGMVYLLLQRRVDLRPHLFPLLPFGTALGFLLLAVPVGLLADRVGRLRVFLLGHGVLLACYLTLLTPLPRAAAVALPLLLLGVFYAATDGVLMAVAAPLAPARLRGGSLALVQTGQAAGRALGAVAFGAAWTAWGPHQALVAAAVTLAAAGAAAALTAHRYDTSPREPAR